jgi:hypothetical protein
VPSTLGAELLATAPYWEFSDVTLLRLTGVVPGGLTYAGWTTEALDVDESVIGVHHPDGSFKRICFGNLLSEGNPDRSRSPVYWVVIWSEGTTEPGSSGSPLFNMNQQVVGQLYGGSASCINMDQPDYYGKFGASYPFLAEYLDPDAPPGMDDDFEQNDAPGEAPVIEEGTYGDLVLLDDDWYQVKLNAYQTLQVQVIFDHQLADVDLAIYDEGLNRLSVSAATQNDSENVQVDADDAGGVFLIRVYGYDGVQAPYAMTVRLGEGAAPPGADDAFEENDSPFDATPIEAGEYADLVAWDEDWFSLEVSADWQFTVQIEFMHAVGDLDMVLYDADFNEIDRSDGVTDVEEITAKNEAKTAQTFFVQIYGYGQDHNSYTLKVTLDSDEQNGSGCGAGVGLANLAGFWSLCLCWLVSQRAVRRRRA